MHFWGAVLYCSFYKVKQFEIIYDNRIHEADKSDFHGICKNILSGEKGLFYHDMGPEKSMTVHFTKCFYVLFYFLIFFIILGYM